MYRIADPQKQAQWEAELAEHVEIEPEDLLTYFDPELIRNIDSYQTATARVSINNLVSQPVIDPLSNQQQIIMNNKAIYDDSIDNLIDQDTIVKQLVIRHDQTSRGEDTARAIRARRTIVAHYIFSTILANNTTTA